MTDAAGAYERICALALKLPGVELGTSYGTPAIKVKGKLMARLRSEAEGGLAIRCDFVERQMLLQAAPEAFFLTPHYQDYPMILTSSMRCAPTHCPIGSSARGGWLHPNDSSPATTRSMGPRRSVRRLLRRAA